jgi:hypothetical protein
LHGHGAKGDIVDDRGVPPLDAASGRKGSDDNRPSGEVAKILQTAIGQSNPLLGSPMAKPAAISAFVASNDRSGEK